MFRTGHLGSSIAVYAPFGAGLLVVGEPTLAVFAGAVMLWLTMLPDVDYDLPLVEHRGPTHSLLFACLVGGVFASGGWILASEFGLSAGIDLMHFGFLLGFVTVGAHLLADALTPAGVPLLWPVSSRSVSLSLFTANNTIANYGLFVFGLLAAAGVFALVARTIGF